MTYMPDPIAGTRWLPPHLGVPRSVAVAVKLMYAGAVLEIITVIWSVVRVGSLTTELSDRGFTTSEAHSIAAHDTAALVTGGLIAVGLWLWMARANAAGRHWARTFATVLFAVDTLAVLVILLTLGLGGIYLAGLTWFVAFAAVLCLWRRDASHYFSQHRRDVTQHIAPPRYM